MERPAVGVNIILEWALGVIIMPIAPKACGLLLAPLPERAWRLLVIVVLTVAMSTGLGFINGFLGWLAGLIVFWAGIIKVFDIDLFGAIIIVVVRLVISCLVGFALAGRVAASA
jgi:hypothetical protein